MQTMSPEGAGTSNWIERLQGIVNETVERSAASSANLQRLLAAVAVPGISPETLTAELARFGQTHGLEAYQQLAELGMRFLSRSLQLVSRYRDEYLRELIPAWRLASAGLAPAIPPPPDGTNAAGWAGWYQLFGAWVTEQQAWSARLYRVLLEEVSSGALHPDAVQTSAREFLQRRLPDYLADMAELNAELVSDLMGLADGSVDRLSEALGFDELVPEPEELVMSVHGAAGTTAGAALLIENTRPAPSLVSCLVSSQDGFGLQTAPTQFQLSPGESRQVVIRVSLPGQATGGQQEAGSVTIRGQGDRDLVVRVRAEAEALSPS